jgi:hypothetical protein
MKVSLSVSRGARMSSAKSFEELNRALNSDQGSELRDLYFKSTGRHLGDQYDLTGPEDWNSMAQLIVSLQRSVDEANKILASTDWPNDAERRSAYALISNSEAISELPLGPTLATFLHKSLLRHFFKYRTEDEMAEGLLLSCHIS